MSELSPQARHLLAEARPGLEPDAERLARVRERLLAATSAAAAGAVVMTAAVTGAPAIGAPAVASPTAPLVPATAATKAAGLGATTLVGLGVVVLGVVVAAVLLVPRLESSAGAGQGATAAPLAPAPAPHVAATTVREVDAPAAGDAIDLDDITLEAARPARPARPASPVTIDRVVAPEPAPAAAAEPVEPAVPDSLTRELAWLRAARAALRAGTPDAALVALAGYQDEFTAGQLAEEAAALVVEASCAAGRPDVEALRAAFMRRWPTSTARARVERACR